MDNFGVKATVKAITCYWVLGFVAILEANQIITI